MISGQNGKPTAVVLSLSRIDIDGRVLRQISALEAMGHRVLRIGIRNTGASETAEKDSSHAIPLPVWSRLRKIEAAAVLLASRVSRSPRSALTTARAVPGVEELRSALAHALTTGAIPRSAIVVANDWTALPAALDAYFRWGMKFYYDTHEFALQEHSSSTAWRLLFPPLIKCIEGEGLRRALCVTCVSPGIAKAMQAEYRLPSMPHVIRNLPQGMPMAPRTPAEPFQVLYHGLFKPDRGIETLVAGVKLWPNNFRLVLRGRAPNSTYQARVERLVAEDSTGRISIEPMAPQDRIVAAANASDIGVMVFDTRSAQNHFAMPNKLFEYLHAGLVPIAAGGSDAANLLAEHGLGLAIDPTDTTAIPRYLATLNAETLFAAKRASHEAAKKLIWEEEAKTLSSLLPPPRAMTR